MKEHLHYPHGHCSPLIHYCSYPLFTPLSQCLHLILRMRSAPVSYPRWSALFTPYTSQQLFSRYHGAQTAEALGCSAGMDVWLQERPETWRSMSSSGTGETFGFEFFSSPYLKAVQKSLSSLLTLFSFLFFSLEECKSRI